MDVDEYVDVDEGEQKANPALAFGLTVDTAPPKLMVYRAGEIDAGPA